jgi:phage protein D
MIGQVRTAHPAIILDGTDYYSRLAPYLTSFKYEDNCDGKKADDLSFELADRDGKFISTWMPKKGAFFDASIITERWFAPIASDLSLDCGRFWIDSIEFVLPDHKVVVKAQSIPTDVRIKQSKETRGWEKTSLQDIANQIAGENNMSLDWQASVNPRYLRTEMHDESSLGFIMKRAHDAKLAIKVHRNKIVIFDEQKLEEAAPQFTLLYGNTAGGGGGATYRMTGGHFITKVTDTTKKSKVSYIAPESGEVQSGTYTAEDGSGNGEGGDETGGDDQGDRDNSDPDNEEGDTSEGNGGNGGKEAPAQRLTGTDFSGGDQAGVSLKAKSNVRDKNKKKDQSRIELSIGNPLIAAGMTFNLVGCGQFDGKWFVETAHHSVAPEYNTELTVRKCLQGY